MKKLMIMGMILLLMLAGCRANETVRSPSARTAEMPLTSVAPVTQASSAGAADRPADNIKGNLGYSLEQAMSDNAQLSTIAFNGLAFMTGNAGADSFMPPGKVADFFGFQYMRDMDTAGFGHNTQFLTRAACNVLSILNDSQKAELAALAREQAPVYVSFAFNRFPILRAFRLSLEGKSGLDSAAVAAYTANLYKTDADLTVGRAMVVGRIIASFTDEQKASFARMSFDNFSTWPSVDEDETLKKSMGNTEYVAVMTYASELFSWYKGSVAADIYFCPERHGTYFGGFFMKDYPAMNNPGYFISTAITGDKGRDFLSILTAPQRAAIEAIIGEQKPALSEIAEIRTKVAGELRKAQTGGAIDKEMVYSLIERYGYLDGQVSALYAQRFAQVKATLSADQMTALYKLRDLDITVDGAYQFSSPVSAPELPDIDYLFGSCTMPDNAGQYPVPATFVPNVNPPRK